VSARLAEPAEAVAASDILSRAFVHDPLLTAFIREGPDRTERMARYFELECRLTLSGYGELWLDDGLFGAAIWRRPGGYPEPLLVQLRLLPRYLRLFPREFLRASRAMSSLARLHPREPHWYLLAVGVVPEETGKGRGSALLKPVLRRCDSDATPAYLEASTTDNARLYERLGFETRDELEVLPGVCVRLMWRDPH
jgi:GNAT superfamily N-acetyltransferase